MHYILPERGRLNDDQEAALKSLGINEEALFGASSAFDKAVEDLEAHQGRADTRFEEIENQIIRLEGTSGVICRCHGEIDCEEQFEEYGLKAPMALVSFLGFETKKLAGKDYRYCRFRVEVTHGNTMNGQTTVSIEGLNGIVVRHAEAIWEEQGYDKHGAYKHVLGKCEVLKMDAEAAEQAKVESGGI